MKSWKSKIYLNDPSETAIEPSWARHHLEAYEISTLLLDLIRGQTRDIGPVLHAMFNEDTERLTKVIDREMDGKFVQDLLYTELGKGVIIGYALRCYEDEDIAARLEAEEDGEELS